MKNVISIPSTIVEQLRAHLFQNDLEQGAFLFADAIITLDEVRLTVTDIYLVPPNGWAIQKEVYLEMKDSERAKIMKIARDRKCCVVDCHSHPHSQDDVWFSPSDRLGISEFAQYAKWKLSGRPFAAMVWGEASIDAIMWHSNFEAALLVDEVLVGDSKLIPRGSWFNSPRGFHRFSDEY